MKHPVVKFCVRHKAEIIFVVVAALLIHFMLNPMRNIYYAYDEWKAVGSTYINGILGQIKLLSPLEIFSGKARVLALLMFNATSYFAPFQAYPFVITAYIVHFLNALLIYTIVQKYSKSKFMAFMAGIFFATGGVASQVFSWLGATYENLGNTFFLLLSIWLYTKLPKKSIRFWNLKLLSAWVLAFISYYFKETSIVLIFLLPWVYWNTHKEGKNSATRSIKLHAPLIGVFFCIGISRLLTHYIIRGHPAFTQQTHASAVRIFFHLLYYPFTTLAQLFIPYDFMVRLPGLFLNINYSNVLYAFLGADRYVLQYYILADYLSFIVTVTIFFYLYAIVRQTKKYRVLLSFALIYYLLQHVPLAFYDKAKNSAYFDFHYYYAFLPAGAIIFAILINSVHEFLARVLRSSSLAVVIVILFASGYFYKQALVMHRNILGASVYSQRTKSVMEQFTKARPTLPDKPVIFLSGDAGYYGYLYRYIPIELNPGYALMVWYYKTGKIPGELILEPYNFDSGEGYRVIGDKAYGYFDDKKDLLALYEQNSSLSVNQVVGFYYEGKTNILSDNTREIRGYLQRELAEKQSHK